MMDKIEKIQQQYYAEEEEERANKAALKPSKECKEAAIKQWQLVKSTMPNRGSDLKRTISHWIKHGQYFL